MLFICRFSERDMSHEGNPLCPPNAGISPWGGEDPLIIFSIYLRSSYISPYQGEFKGGSLRMGQKPLFSVILVSYFRRI